MNWLSPLWLAVALTLLLLIERWIHRHLQGVMILLTGDPEIAVVLYALPLLPGIILHELSHALAAILLGVRVGGISIRPKVKGKRVQLGFVPVEQTDVVRASLIGLAPLLTGSGVILAIGYWVFHLGTIGTALLGRDWSTLFDQLRMAMQAADAWIWAYVIFAVSNTMVPSESDRRAWPPILIFLLICGVLVWVTGLGPTLLERIGDPLAMAVEWLALIATFTVTVDGVFVVPIALLERIVGRVKGLEVQY